jgi:anti-sigma B factor antagonist
MNVTSRQIEHYTILETSGRLDTDTSRDFEQVCTTTIEEGARHLIVDLGGVDFVSSAGLRAILATAKRLKPMGGGLAICRLAPAVQDVFRISGFGRLMPVVEDVEAARAALQ